KSSILLILDDGDILKIGPHDYPDYYTEELCHPKDYIISDKPIPFEGIMHCGGLHHRLIARLSVKLSEKEYLPLSFLVDTGAGHYLYFCKKARTILYDKKVLLKNGAENDYIKTQGKFIPWQSTPHTFEPANSIGLGLIFQWNGLVLNFKESIFSFGSDRLEHL
ncbi:unnamed protein product, partial [Didymodactylos carnosus]